MNPAGIQGAALRPERAKRPVYLFSGLMECGCCGAGFSKISKDSFGCSAARQKGAAVCTNMATIRRQNLESAVLNALAHHLMDPEAVEIFCQEYAAERNRLQAQADAGRSGLEKELRQVTGDHRKLVDAILVGVPADQVKDRMIELDGRRKDVEGMLSAAPAPDPVRFHPRMARTYRTRVGQLIRGLADPDGGEEAKEALRALVEKIVLAPEADEDGGTTLAIDLQGALAGLLCPATGRPMHRVAAGGHADAASGAHHEAVNVIDELVLVAGAGFEPAAFRL